MKNYPLFLLLMAILLISITGCGKVTPTYSPEELSNSLVITYYEGPEIQIDGHIQALLRNTSKYCIVFPIDLGIKLYMVKKGNITEINNYTAYVGDHKRYLNPKGDLNDFISVSFDPDVSRKTVTDSLKFYAEITGHLCDDDSVVVKKKIPFIVTP